MAGRLRQVPRKRSNWQNISLTNASNHIPHTRSFAVERYFYQPVSLISQGIKGRYCALSYCWGKATANSSFYKTTKANLLSHENAMPLHELPATLRDTIVVARNLGFQYIWINAICIVQDNRVEWAHEVANMQHVYAGAFLTISTMASSSSKDGLFRLRETHNSTTVCLNYRIPKAFREYAWQAGSTPHQVPGSPMYLVACPNILPTMEPSMYRPTLQEQIISTRILYYGRGILWWEYFDLYASEGYPRPLHLSNYAPWERSETKNAVRGVLTDRWGDTDVFKHWQQLVYDYTGRTITERRDRLTAIVGLGHTIEPFMKSKFIAGVWPGDRLLESLCWEASVTAFVLYNLAGHLKAYGAMRCIADVVSFDANISDEAQAAVTGSITLKGTVGRLAKPAEWNTDEGILDPYRQDCMADPIDQCWYINVLESDMWTPTQFVRLLLHQVNIKTKTFRQIGIGLRDSKGCSEIIKNKVIVLI
ncbi:hypothetical protein CFAM422_007493 [Trichoderma lentiforme]|uniref:Heterokaryon incompatibility domain-containing protein n=1 Tax=Trichoderma lentiforme TaxID=1567552 RepID=A0A9P5CB60_9HYPO|nr:hypothetical protein CFAM422_007493 [Trichoderma lentiforme]